MLQIDPAQKDDSRNHQRRAKRNRYSSYQLVLPKEEPCGDRYEDVCHKLDRMDLVIQDPFAKTHHLIGLFRHRGGIDQSDDEFSRKGPVSPNPSYQAYDRRPRNDPRRVLLLGAQVDSCYNDFAWPSSDGFGSHPFEPDRSGALQTLSFGTV